jgi:hypothetical protein
LICIFLDLTIYTFCKHRSSEEECVHLYGGNEQNKRYYTCLKKALAEIPAHIDLGCSRSDIGTHIYAGKVICALVDIAVVMGVIEGEDSITLLNGTSVFDFAFPILIETLYAPDT